MGITSEHAGVTVGALPAKKVTQQASSNSHSAENLLLMLTVGDTLLLLLLSHPLLNHSFTFLQSLRHWWSTTVSQIIGYVIVSPSPRWHRLKKLKVEDAKQRFPYCRCYDSPTAAATIPLPPLLQTQTNYWRQPLFFTGLLPTHDEWVNDECIKPSLPCFLLTIKEKACRTSPSYEGEKSPLFVVLVRWLGCQEAAFTSADMEVHWLASVVLLPACEDNNEKSKSLTSNKEPLPRPPSCWDGAGRCTVRGFVALFVWLEIVVLGPLLPIVTRSKVRAVTSHRPSCHLTDGWLSSIAY